VPRSASHHRIDIFNRKGRRGRRILRENRLSYLVIGAAIEVHRHLGPGLLESAYEECLCCELNERKLGFERQKPVGIGYKEIDVDCGFRIDLLIERRLVVEVKSVLKLHPVHTAQVLTYLKLTRLQLGLLINFNVTTLRDGIHRIALTL
jgi:GxxExxY protein